VLRPLVVFVALGSVKSYFVQNLEFAARWVGAQNVVVISDVKSLRLSNVGQVVPVGQLVNRERKKELTQQLKARGVNTRWRGGYWVSILMRFEAIRAYADTLDPLTSLIHVENDVATFLSEESLQALHDFSGEQVLVPPLDMDHSCPGIVFAKTAPAMSKVCSYVVQSVGDGSEPSDMHALGTLRKSGSIGCLPTRASAVLKVDDTSLVFDSVVVGQYLFGSDPRNSQGVAVPGYRYVRGNFDPGLLRDWRLTVGQDGVQRVSASDEGQMVEFASLHIHAKRSIPDPETNPEAWNQVLSWANGLERPRLEIRLRSVIFSKFYEWASPKRRRLRRLLSNRSGPQINKQE
jgi:hypothetical protein